MSDCPHPEKQSYETKAAAKRALSRLSGRHGKKAIGGRDALHAYRCPGCRLFHIGHKKPVPKGSPE